jgi:hypothetical protein
VPVAASTSAMVDSGIKVDMCPLSRVRTAGETPCSHR